MTDNEKILLGQMLIDIEVYYKAAMNQEDFVSKDAKMLYMGIDHLINTGTAPDIINLSKTVPSVPVGEIATLTDFPTAASWEYYAKEIREASRIGRLNKLVLWGQDLIRTHSSDEILHKLQYGIDKISTNQTRYDIVPVKDAVGPVVNKIEERYNNRGQLPGIPTGYSYIDQHTAGFQDERLIVIGARPSDGKSALMKDLSVNMALAGVPVGVITTESDIGEFMARTFAGMTEINSQSLVSGQINADKFKDITAAAGRLYDAPLYLYDQPNADILTIRRIARRMVKYYGVRIIFIDYIQNIRHPDHQMPKNLQVADISGQLKEMSRDYKIPVVAMAQLKRPEGHAQKPRPPIMSDLGWTGSMEQDADIVIMIHHDVEKDDEGNDIIIGTKLLIRKNRDGPKKAVAVQFKPHFVTFLNKQIHHEDQQGLNFE